VGQVLIIPQNDEAHVAAPTPVDVTPVTAVTPVPALAVSEPVVTGRTDVYVVKRGDILSRIAGSFGVTIQALVAANRLDSPDRIYAGQTLTIPNTTVKKPTEPPAPLPTETPTPSPTEVQPTPSATQTTVEVTDSPPPGDYLFIRPVPLQDGWIPRGYSYWHPGIDIILPIGTPIRAASGGIVEFSGWNANGFGNLVVLDHGNGYRTLYAHQSERLVAEGGTVAQGDVIGLVGITGWATHSHLHFEIRQGYRPVFPCDHLPGGCQ
jgi:murein DD-endopeptidase MepM/ murein hydrolase activator NlpD